tara:strand:- start:572 stop:1312 length:741 start_codon:yes stop_codon:yes gene_type:complete
MVEKIFKTDLEAAKYMVEQSGQSSWLLEQTTTISRQQIARIINDETQVVRNTTMQKLAIALGYQLTHSNQGVTLSPHTNKIKTGAIEMDLLVQTQQKLIKNQEKQINHLSSKLKRFKKKTRLNVICDFKVKQIITSAPDMIEIIDCRIEGSTYSLGYEKDEMVAWSLQDWLDLYHPRSLKVMNNAMAQNRDELVIYHFRFEQALLKNTNGNYKLFNVDVYFDKISDGRQVSRLYFKSITNGNTGTA